MKAHRRQFLIGLESRRIEADWQTLRIAENIFLSFCPELPVSTVRDLNGKDWNLLGLAIQTEAGKDDPLTGIGKSTTKEIKELYRQWNGRWVLIGDDEIHMDCFGLLGCFYTSVNGKNWISSSLALLKEIGGFLPRPENLEHKSDFEFYPPPLTRFEGVFKLLPSQVLNIKTFLLRARSLPQPIEEISYNEVLDRLIEKMSVSLLNIAKLHRNIFLPLTAGFDSRLILAAARYSGIDVQTYTAGQPAISKADLRIPCKLAGKAGYVHRFIRMDPSHFSKEKEILYDYHTAGNSNDIDRKRFSYGQWDNFGKGDIILRGGGLEIGRCVNWRKFRPHCSLETLTEDAHPQHVSFKRHAFSQWLEWVNKTPAEGFDWRDRYYWEQRVGGWLSSIEQSLDLTRTERFYLVNSYEIASLFLTPPVKIRKANRTHIDLIRKMAPDLLRYPLNPVTVSDQLKRFTRISISGLYRKIEKKAEIYFDSSNLARLFSKNTGQ